LNVVGEVTKTCPVPVITDTVVEDCDQLGAAIDALKISSRKITRLHKQIRASQHRLRKAVNDKQWRLFMRYEELANTATAISLSLIARAFYSAGKRARK
jgi:hypothetical protein